MKTLLKIFLLMLVLTGFTACFGEDVIEVNPEFELSFERDGQTNAYAGETFYVIRKGSGEYLSLYDGNSGKVFGEELSTGVFFSRSDSLPVIYNTAGKYMLTVVSSSTEDYGNKVNRKHKTVEINVEDRRHGFENFVLATEFGEYRGNIQGDAIHISVPDIMTDFKLKAIFNLTSPAAKAFVGDAQQVSNETVNDFSSPVTYRIEAANGEVRNIVVTVSTFPASNEKQLLRFQLAPQNPDARYFNSNGEVGIIDEENKTISLSVNYGTQTTARIQMLASDLSRIYIEATRLNPWNSNLNYNLSTIRTIQVEAQNKTRAIYALNIVDQDPITSFTFTGLNPAPQAVIDKTARTVTIQVLNGTDISKLVAKWTGSVGRVDVGSVTQVNGVTVNDFTNPVEYRFYKGNTLGVIYTVTVNVL